MASSSMVSEPRGFKRSDALTRITTNRHGRLWTPLILYMSENCERNKKLNKKPIFSLFDVDSEYPLNYPLEYH